MLLSRRRQLERATVGRGGARVVAGEVGDQRDRGVRFGLVGKARDRDGGELARAIELVRIGVGVRRLGVEPQRRIGTLQPCLDLRDRAGAIPAELQRARPERVDLVVVRKAPRRVCEARRLAELEAIVDRAQLEPHAALAWRDRQQREQRLALAGDVVTLVRQARQRAGGERAFLGRRIAARQQRLQLDGGANRIATREQRAR